MSEENKDSLYHCHVDIQLSFTVDIRDAIPKEGYPEGEQAQRDTLQALLQDKTLLREYILERIIYNHFDEGAERWVETLLGDEIDLNKIVAKNFPRYPCTQDCNDNSYEKCKGCEKGNLSTEDFDKCFDTTAETPQVTFIERLIHKFN